MKHYLTKGGWITHNFVSVPTSRYGYHPNLEEQAGWCLTQVDTAVGFPCITKKYFPVKMLQNKVCA